MIHGITKWQAVLLVNNLLIGVHNLLARCKTQETSIIKEVERWNVEVGHHGVYRWNVKAWHQIEISSCVFSGKTISPLWVTEAESSASSKRQATTGGSAAGIWLSQALSSERTLVVPIAITLWPAALVPLPFYNYWSYVVALSMNDVFSRIVLCYQPGINTHL